MKNILGIIVLSFLLSGCGGDTATVSSQVFGKNENYIKLGKDSWSDIKGTTNTETRTHRNIASNHCSQFNKSAFQYSNYFNDPDHGPTVATFYCYDKYVASKNGANLIWSNSSNTASSSSSTNTDDKITQSKQICRDLGFKDGTGKFSDCALKMMSIQFEATNKVASSSGGTTQEIIVKHKQDYDIFDAMLDMSNALLSNGNNSSSSSSNNNTRCVIGKTNPMFGTTTMNCR